MYIHEAVQKALEEDKYMYRISWLATLFSGNRKQKAIRPEMRAEPCIEVFMWDGDEVRRSRGWKPDLYELMADDWELMERPQKHHQAYREKGNTAENEIAGDAAIEQPEKPLPPKQEYDADSIKKAIVETGKKCKDIIFVL